MKTSMRYTLLASALIMAAVIGCGSTRMGSQPSALPRDELDVAIRDVSNCLNANIPENSKIVILNIETKSDNLSEYIIEELISNAISSKKFSVVDRRHIEAIQSVQKFELSGLVANEDAVKIGKFFGAHTIISGAIQEMGNRYRMTISALDVKTAEVQSKCPRNIATAASEMLTDLVNTEWSRPASAAYTGAVPLKKEELSITSNPSGATVEINSKKAGVTPLSYKPDSWGSITVVISMPGYETVKKSIKYNGEKTNLTFTLTKTAAKASAVSGLDNKTHGDIKVPGSATTVDDQDITDYTEAIRRNPNDVNAYRNRGISYYNKGNMHSRRKENDRAIEDYNRAIEDYSRAIRLSPNYAKTYFDRGNVYYDKDDYDRAVADYSEAIRLNPNDAEAYNSRGDAYYNNDDYDEAVADYTAAIRLSPNYAKAYQSRGNAYYDKKNYDRAIADYTEAIRLDPKNAAAYSDRGNVYYERKDYDRAINDYEYSLRLDSKQTGIRTNLEAAKKKLQEAKSANFNRWNDWDDDD